MLRRRCLFERRPRPAADLLQNDRQRAEAGKGCLQHVQPHKRGEEQPIRRMIMGENEAPQNDDARKGQNDTVDAHELLKSPQFALPTGLSILVPAARTRCETIYSAFRVNSISAFPNIEEKSSVRVSHPCRNVGPVDSSPRAPPAIRRHAGRPAEPDTRRRKSPRPTSGWRWIGPPAAGRIHP